MNRAQKILRLVEQGKEKEPEVDLGAGAEERKPLHTKLMGLRAKLRDAEKPEQQGKLKDKIKELEFEYTRNSI